MQKILIIKPSSLGDIIHAMGIVASIKRQMNAQIDWVVKEEFASFLKSSSLVDNFLIFKRKKSLKNLLELRKQIRACEYDYVLDMQGLFRSGMMTFWAKSKNKIGRKDSREFASLFYNSTIKLSEKKHAVDILSEFLPALGLEKTYDYPSFIVDENFCANIKNPIIIFSDTRRPEKLWKYFKELCVTLLESGENVILAGKESSFDPDSLNHYKNFYNYLGKTKLPELPSLVAQAKACVCNDSGPLHLSAIMQKISIGVFTATEPELYGPYPLSSAKNFAFMSENKDKDIEKILNAINFGTLTK